MADGEKQPAATVQLILAAFQKIGYPPESRPTLHTRMSYIYVYVFADNDMCVYGEKKGRENSFLMCVQRVASILFPHFPPINLEFL